MEKCEESFPNVSLPVILSEFSVPSSLGDHKDVLGLPQQQVREREREGVCACVCYNDNHKHTHRTYDNLMVEEPI